MSYEYLKNATSPATQREAQPNMVQNSAGGYVHQADDWTRLERFLILGSEGGSYYASERALTRENADVVKRCLAADGPRTVAAIVEISEAGRAPKNDQAILALAMAAKLGDENTRTIAYAMVPRVCRIGTHLYHFVQFATDLGGWGRGMRRAVGKWFNDKPVEKLAYQLVKYQQRDGWSSRDLLRLAHPTPATPNHGHLYKWATSGEFDESLIGRRGVNLDLVAAFEAAKRAESVGEVVALITAHDLPREAVPTQWLKDPQVWEALLQRMPIGAMIRNLATMTRIGLIAPLSAALAHVRSQLGDAERIRRARVHPIAVLSAMMTYRTGRSLRGDGTWAPNQSVIDALDGAFYLSFGSVKPSGKKMLLALDVSGSMNSGHVAGVQGLSPRMASAAMALVTAAVEPDYHIVGFTSGGRGTGFGGKWGGGPIGISDVAISPTMRLDQAIAVLDRMPMGGTDCALPMVWAKERKVDVDGFVVYTDSETWAGAIQPHEALRQYRRERNQSAKSVVVGMVSNGFTIADPEDAGMLDVVGFDTATPQVISSFIGGSTESAADSE